MVAFVGRDDEGGLSTARLRLRPLGPQDAAGLFAVFSDPQVARYWSAPAWTERRQADRSLELDGRDIERGSALRLGIFRRHDDRLIGTVSLFDVNDQCRRGEIGYALTSAAWGHGYATEAVGALVAYCFGPLDFIRLEADIDPRNTASARVLERLGFRCEGVRPQRWIVAGEVTDSAMYGLLRDP